MSTISVGTSSWADPGFVEEWYPSDLAANERLAWYAQHFDAVEVNSTWYAVPNERTVQRWVDQTPDDFTFDVKVHRLLSRHAGDLKSVPKDLRRGRSAGRIKLTAKLEAQLAQRTLEVTAPLAEAGKLRAFLLQLSPAFAPNTHKLSELDPLAELLSPLAVEFRHRAWLNRDHLEDTLGHLEQIGAVFVCVDAPRGKPLTLLPPVDAVTNPELAYFRAHGRNAEGWQKGKTVAERFGYDYSDGELAELKERVDTLAEDVPNVQMMFNNNRGADAPHAAERFRELLGQKQAA